MNCKPGDLAIIVNADCEWNYRDVGKIVHVIDRDAIAASDGETMWVCDTLGQKLHCLDSAFGTMEQSDGVEWVGIPDACLRPIRGDSTEREESQTAGKPVMEPA